MQVQSNIYGICDRSQMNPKCIADIRKVVKFPTRAIKFMLPLAYLIHSF